MTPFYDLVENLTLEEKAAVNNAISARIRQIETLPDAQLRARIFVAAALIAAAEIMKELEGREAAVTQLRRVAMRLESAV